MGFEFVWWLVGSGREHKLWLLGAGRDFVFIEEGGEWIGAGV
jgi:hypothetical protein